ncbi:MAG: glycosyltransferase [Chlorobiota bacterium]|nr:glycosyltransferase [Chlorobiota bacterium]QQS66522.1 MAG: glycosyltransferase [Chlorobiota bacterium]
MKIKFVYFSHQTLQVPRVARQCIVALCNAICLFGIDTDLVSFRTFIHKDEQVFPSFNKLYGVDSELKNKSFKIIGHDNGGEINDIQRLIVYFFYLIKYFFLLEYRKYEFTIFSSRNNSILKLLNLFKLFFNKKMIVIADVHGIPNNISVNRKVDGNMCISNSLANEIKKRFSIETSKITFAHGGVDVKKYKTLHTSKYNIRKELGLPTNKKIICYAGKVYYRYDEVGYLVEASKYLDSNSIILIIGGRADQVEKWINECKKHKIEKVIFKSFVPPLDIVKYLKCADLLVMYYSPSELNEYRSPAKLFDYLISGTPLIAAKFKSTEEIIIDNENGFLVEPYKPELLGHKLTELLNSKIDFNNVSSKAIETAKSYTWERRASAFISYANALYSNKVNN